MIYFQLFYTFFCIGLFTFGGGYAMIPMIKEQVVGNGWITEEALTDFIAISEMTPGPFALNISTFVGNTVAGFGGAAVSTIGVILPSLIIITIIAMIMNRFLKNRFVQGALSGVKPIVLSLILSTTIILFVKIVFFSGSSFGKEIKIDKASFVLFLMLFGFMLIYKKNKKKSLNPLWILGLSALFGLILFI